MYRTYERGEGSLTVVENTDFGVTMGSTSARPRNTSRQRSAISAWKISANFPPPTSRPDRNAGLDWPGCSWRTGRFGCSTSRTASLDRRHLKAGRGCQRPHQVGRPCVIATHMPLPLDAARMLELAEQRMAAEELSGYAVRRDVRLAVREGGAIGTALGFFLVVVSLMPLGLGPDPICWRASQPAFCGSPCCSRPCCRSVGIFAADYEDGTLEVLAPGRWPLELGGRQNRSLTGSRRAAARPLAPCWGYC